MHVPKFHRYGSQRSNCAGFSLVELSVVLAIISVIAVMGLELTANYLNRTAYKVTQERLAAIDQALAGYLKVNNKLPCPGQFGLQPTAACFAKECNGTGANGTSRCTVAAACTDIAGQCYADTLATGNLFFGDVPVRDLGLPPATMMDGYGNRIYYVVTRDYVYNYTYNPGTNFSTASDGIDVRSGKLDSSCGGGSLCQSRGTAAYFLFSVGADKRRGTTLNGNMAYGCQDNVAVTDGMIDTVNCRLNNAGISLVKNGATPITIPDNVFYDSRFNTGTTDNHFDDLVRWRPRSAL